MTRCLLFVTLLATGCGGTTASTPVEPVDTTDTSTSSGGEISSPTVVSTVPEPGPGVIAVPLSGVPRAELRAELQDLYGRIEAAAAIAPPNPPDTADEDSLTAYIGGTFQAWVTRRVAATQEASRVAAALTGLSATERGFAVALVGYAYEDIAASVRGMPVPEVLSGDLELMRMYQETIDRALLPIAEYSATAYDGCARLFAEANDPAWAEWGPFCATRVEDLREVFGRYAHP